MTSQGDSYSLFLDACDGIKIGLLNSEQSWLEYVEVPIKKASTVLFVKVNEILKKYNISLDELAQIFICLGPGSYTGIRLLQGMKELYLSQGIKVFSFYSFEIPALANIEKGCFITSAYKNEFYIYEWENETQNQKIINREDLSQFTNKTLYGSNQEINDLNTTNVYTILENKSKEVITALKESESNRDAFYFRPLEQEFKMNFPDL